MNEYQHPEDKFASLATSAMEAYRQGNRDEAWRLLGEMTAVMAQVDDLYRRETEAAHAQWNAARLAARNGSANSE